MTDIWLLARKDLKLLLRDRAGFFFTFFWPVVMAVFFGSVFGGASSQGRQTLRLLVVDQDQSRGSADLVAGLVDAPDVAVEHSDLETAIESVRRGSAPAYLLLPPGFGEANADRFVSGAPRVTLTVDSSRVAEAGMLEGVLLRSGASLLQRSFTDAAHLDRMINQSLERLDDGPSFEGRGQLMAFFEALRGLNSAGFSLPEGAPMEGAADAGALQPLAVERVEMQVSEEPPNRPKNPYAISFAQAMLWAILGCAASFGISLALERTQGTLLRLRMSPLAAWSILLGKGLACFVTALGVSLLLVALSVVVFGVRPLSWPLLFVALISTALCFVGIMMLLSVLGRTERSAAGIGWAILLMLSMFGGGMVPLFIMPSWMLALSDYSPVKWGILAIEGAVWRGFSWNEMVLPCAILLAIGGATYFAGARLFRWGATG